MTMTAEQLAQLRVLAERAISDGWGYDRDEFYEVLTPEMTLALLNELGAKDITLSARDYYFDQQADRIEYLEKRIAELEARTVTVKLPAHKYRECVNGLLEEAIAYAGTQQLRERISSRLANFVQPDHPHTRCSAGINLTVEG